MKNTVLDREKLKGRSKGDPKKGGLHLGWGDAQVWMNMAEELYERNLQEGLERKALAYPWINEMNVACVCAGYAFELLFKVLVQLGGETPDPKHELKSAHEKLCESDRIEVKRILARHGWSDPTEFMSNLDQELCHQCRKYWMQNREYTSPKHGTFHLNGPKAMKNLGKVHKDLSKWALKKMGEEHRDELLIGYARGTYNVSNFVIDHPPSDAIL